MLSAWVRIVISSREPSSVILGLGRDWVLAIPRFTGCLRDPGLVEQDRHDERVRQGRGHRLLQRPQQV